MLPTTEHHLRRWRDMVYLHMDHLDDYEQKDFPKQRNQYKKMVEEGKKLSWKWLRIKASWIDDNVLQ